MNTETQRNLLHKKWYDFDDYKENDYREIFNHEALYLDDIYRGAAHLNDIQFDEVIEELNYNTYEVLENVIDDIEEVGLEYVAMLGLTMSIKEWKTFIKERKKEGKAWNQLKYTNTHSIIYLY